MNSSHSLLSRQEGVWLRCGGCGCSIPKPARLSGTIDATCSPCRSQIEGDARLEALLYASMKRGMTLREAVEAARNATR